MVNKENYEEYMMLYADRELTAKQEQALMAFVQQHPELQQELDMYAATRLQPDEHIVFADKDSLLKEETTKKAIWLSGWKQYAAAACVVIAIAIFMLNKQHPANDQQPSITIADNKPYTPEQPEETITKQAVKPKAEQLHSNTPVNTIAMETNNSSTHQPPVQKEVHTQEKQLPVLIGSAPHTIDYNISNTVAKEVELPELQTIEQPETTNTNNIAVSTPFDQTKQGLNVLESAVNQKLTAAKDIKNKLKDTEVSVQLGKKEIFTVRL